MADITKDNFVWKMKDETYKLNEMNAEFKLAALIHTLKLMNKNHRQCEKNKEKLSKTKQVLKEKLESITNKIKEYEEEEKHLKQAIEKYNEKSSDFFEKTDYFQSLADILQESLLEDHSLQVPEDIEDLRSFKRMVEQGIIKENAP